MFPPEAVPERIGAYKVLRRLSSSGPADLYLGRSEGPMGFSRVVALKLVPNTGEQDAVFAEELVREAAIISKLNHPAIVRMFDFFEHEKHLVLVLEHVEGVDLEKLQQHLLRRNKRLGDTATFYLGHEVAGALAHAHAAMDDEGISTPVVHRNLRPESVLVGWDGHVRLAGFGLGKILGRTPDTQVGVVKGTPGWMAPEQARGERVTPRADVYGCALLLWSLLARRHPPIDGSRPEKLAKLRPDVPPELGAAIDAALEPIAEKRKITALELEQWLAKVIDVEAGRDELREKVVMLRGTNAELDRGAPRRKSSTSTARMKATTSNSTPGAKLGDLARTDAALRAAGLMKPTTPKPSEAKKNDAKKSADAEKTALAKPVDEIPRPPRLPSDADLSTVAASVSKPAEAAPSAPTPPPSPALATDKPITAAPPGLVPSVILAPELEKVASIAPKGSSIAPKGSSVHPGSPSQAPMPAAGSRPPPSASVPAPAPYMNGESTGDAQRLIALPAHASDTPTTPPAKRSLTALETVGVAALSAAIFMAAGVFVLEHVNKGGPTTAPSAPIVVVVPQPMPAPTATPSSAASASAAPSATPTVPSDPSQLEDGFGLLSVKTSIDGSVYLSGILAGPPNETLKVACGRYYVRIGTAPGAGPPSWLAPGQSVAIPCKKLTAIEVKTPPFPRHH